MMKIENHRKRQVAYSKRRSKITKKVEKISICCNAEVAFVIFSPAGRVSRFSSPKSIDEMLEKYVNLPAVMRYNDMENVEGKLAKLRYLDDIKGDEFKLQILNQKIENLELEKVNKTTELQIVEANVRAYEPLQGEALNIDQLILNEINIKRVLEMVLARKDALRANFALPRMPNNMQSVSLPIPLEGVTYGANAYVEELPFQIDPQIGAQSESHEDPSQNLVDEENEKSLQNQVETISSNYHTQSQFPMITQHAQFPPPVENAFSSVAQFDPKISCWNAFGNGSFGQTTYDIQPPNHERTIPLPLDETFFTTFASNKGQIAMEETQAPNNQILHPTGKLQIGINGPNTSSMNNNTNVFSILNIENGPEIEDCVPVVEELNPPKEWSSNDFLLEDLLQDETPWTSQAQNGGFLDDEWDNFPFEELNRLLN